MRNRSTTKDVFDKLTEEEDSPVREIADSATQDVTAEPDNQVAEFDEPVLSDDEEAAEPETVKKLRGRRLLRRALIAAAVIVLVAALGLAGFFGWQVKQQKDIAAAGHAALEVARNYAVILTSVDNQKIDENFAQVLDGATGEFKNMYSQSATQLRQLLIDNKAVSHGTVVDAAIKSATETKVDVLIFIDQSISNSVNPEPRIDRSRVTITMDRIDNRWLASKVDIR